MVKNFFPTIAIFADHNATETATEELESGAFDIKPLSVLGKDDGAGAGRPGHRR